MAGRRTVEEAFIRQPSGNEFEPLAPLLEGWFGKPFSELPAELRHLVNKHFLISWDSLSPRQQHDVASQSDYSRDPAFDFEGGFWFDLTDRRACWERKKNKEAKDPHKDTEIHDIRLARIELELTELAAEEAEIVAGAPTERRAAMTRIRRQWEERDKNATRRLAGLSSIESPAQSTARDEARQNSATDAPLPKRNGQPRPKGGSASYRNRTGKEPKVRNAIAARMVVDFAGRPDDLHQAKQVLLLNRYQVSVETVRNAKSEALQKLRQKTDKTPTNNK